MTLDAKAAVMALFTGTTALRGLGRCGPGDRGRVRGHGRQARLVFAELHRDKPSAVLATNTSYLDIDAIAHQPRAQDVIGLHFLLPANIMKLLEIVVPRQVAADVVATAFDLARKLGNEGIGARRCVRRFIGNRILAVYRAGGRPHDGRRRLALRGSTPHCARLVYPWARSRCRTWLGDIGWATRKRRAATRDPRALRANCRPPLRERGWLARRPGGLLPLPGWRARACPTLRCWPSWMPSARVGITPRPFTPEEIIRRYLAAMVNEGASVVHEGIAPASARCGCHLFVWLRLPARARRPHALCRHGGLATILPTSARSRGRPLVLAAIAPVGGPGGARGVTFDSLNRRQG